MYDGEEEIVPLPPPVVALQPVDAGAAAPLLKGPSVMVHSSGVEITESDAYRLRDKFKENPGVVFDTTGFKFVRVEETVTGPNSGRFPKRRIYEDEDGEVVSVFACDNADGRLVCSGCLGEVFCTYPGDPVVKVSEKCHNCTGFFAGLRGYRQSLAFLKKDTGNSGNVSL